MIVHYLKLARKALAKNKYYTAINIFGLVCGMFSALVIAKYIGGSLDFDSFHNNSDRIYAVVQEESFNGNPQQATSSTYWGAGEFIRQYDEFEQITRYNQLVESVFFAEGEQGNKSFIENKIFSTDSSFLKIFTFPLIYGDHLTALSRVNAVVMTRSASQRYFGDADPVGKTITRRVPWGEETVYEITGVTEDLPKRSRFNFDFLVTEKPQDPYEYWTVPDCSIFVLAKRSSRMEVMNDPRSHALDHVDPLKTTNRKVKLGLASVASVKLSNTEYLLAAVGVFIVLISWINYINQVVAQSYLRVKEISILRVLGSTKGNLRAQFVVESGIICLISLTLIFILYPVAEPYFQDFTQGHLLPLVGDSSPVNIGFIMVFIAGTAIAALVPAIILFSVDSPAALRGGHGKIEKAGLRKAFVVVQFAISTILMIGIFVINNQLDFMKRRDKGINMEGVLIIKNPMAKEKGWGDNKRNTELFKEKCEQLPFVSGASLSTTVPGESYRHETFISVQGSDEKTLVHLNNVDDKFLSLYEVTFVAGHNFVPNATWENAKSIVLSESAARALDISFGNKLIGKKILDHESGESYNLIGVIKDYHQTSLRNELRPMAFHYNMARGHFSLKINRDAFGKADRQHNLSVIKQVWDQVYPDAAFDSFFVGERFDAQDAEDHYFGILFRYFTMLSVIISCLGLFGLSLLISMKRNREIGVRKTFGASSLDILGLFLKGYLGALALSIIIGAPIAYFLMDSWLQNYSYRVDIGITTMLVAVMSLAAIFLVTVSYHTIKSSLLNPVKVLKD